MKSEDPISDWHEQQKLTAKIRSLRIERLVIIIVFLLFMGLSNLQKRLAYKRGKMDAYNYVTNLIDSLNKKYK